MGYQQRNNMMMGGPRPQIPRPGQQVQVDLKDATPKKCQCGCPFFQQVFGVMTVSALVSPIGREMIATRPIFICLDCRMPLEAQAEPIKEAQEQ